MSDAAIETVTFAHWRLVHEPNGPFLVHTRHYADGYWIPLDDVTPAKCTEWIAHIERKNTGWMPDEDKREFALALEAYCRLRSPTK